MKEPLQELKIYKDLMDLLEAAVTELKAEPGEAPIDMRTLSECTKLYCMLKDGLRDDIKNGVWEKLLGANLTRGSNGA